MTRVTLFCRKCLESPCSLVNDSSPRDVGFLNAPVLIERTMAFFRACSAPISDPSFNARYVK